MAKHVCLSSFNQSWSPFQCSKTLESLNGCKKIQPHFMLLESLSRSYCHSSTGTQKIWLAVLVYLQTGVLGNKCPPWQPNSLANSMLVGHQDFNIICIITSLHVFLIYWTVDKTWLMFKGMTPTFQNPLQIHFKREMDVLGGSYDCGCTQIYLTFAS